MRMQTRLLWTFLVVHVTVALCTGLTAWIALHYFLRAQAAESAHNVAKAVVSGGFRLTPEVRQRIAQLTAYEFDILDAPEPPLPGTIQAHLGGVVVRIDYRTPTYRQAQRLVLAGTLSLTGLGILLITAFSWWTAAGLARPLEVLAQAAREIGNGRFDRAVPAIGSGEVRRLAADLDAMRQHLLQLTDDLRRAERLTTLGLFTATIAHEVRNPLSAVRLTVQLLARRHPDEQALRLIADEIERLDLIVDELVSYSGGMRHQPRDCSLRDLAADCVRLLARQAEHAGVTIRIEGDGRRAAVDPARIRQLLLNLLLNAIQAQPDGGEVIIRIDDAGLAVIDRGAGVDPAIAKQLFEPFSSGRRDGTGLGLHLARTIARAHGGEITYEPGNPGAIFRVTGLSPITDAATSPT
jgi:signal transduction histidine kinase